MFDSFGLFESRVEPSFCYMMYVDKDDEKPFKDLQKDLELGGELTRSGTFHATVRYVKDNDYKPFIEYLKEQKELPKFEAKCTGFAIYGQLKDALVIEIESEELHKWFKKVNKWLNDKGYPKSDYDTYKPHITLTEQKGIKKPEWKKEYERKVTLGIHVVSNKNYNEVYRSRNKA